MLIPFVSGLLFGLGLAVSNMVNPQRVLAFLDVFGTWDPTLVLVMSVGTLVTLPGFYFVLKREKPLFSEKFALPTKTDIDKNLVLGAAIFGVGWGLSGFCPGPVLAALVSLNTDVLLFCAVMIASWWATDKVLSSR